MTKIELSNYFTKNIKEINLIIKKHNADKFFVDEILISNLYLELYSKIQHINENNIMGYIITFASKQKIWRQNKSYNFTEKIGKEELSDNMDLELNSVRSSTLHHELNINEEQTIKNLETKFKLTISSMRDKLLFQDLLSNEFKRHQDVMLFYGVSKPHSFVLMRKIRGIENDYYKYCVNILNK